MLPRFEPATRASASAAGHPLLSTLGATWPWAAAEHLGCAGLGCKHAPQFPAAPWWLGCACQGTGAVAWFLDLCVPGGKWAQGCLAHITCLILTQGLVNMEPALDTKSGFATNSL